MLILDKFISLKQKSILKKNLMIKYRILKKLMIKYSM